MTCTGDCCTKDPSRDLSPVQPPLAKALDARNNVDAAIATAFYAKALETSEGPEKLCEEILKIPLSKLLAVATNSETPEDCQTVVGEFHYYGHGLLSWHLLDALLFVYGGILSEREMQAAYSRAAYRTRKRSKGSYTVKAASEEVQRLSKFLSSNEKS